MRIIQSFWSSPMYNGLEGKFNNRHGGGWLQPRYHLMSWGYSCMQLRQFYNSVELYTDRSGKELLIDELKLPYTRVHVCLDWLNCFSPELWALGKVFTYCLQEIPFIHVDGDVYIAKRFSEKIENAALVAQNLEKGFPFYKEVVARIINEKWFVPQSILENWNRPGTTDAFNLGIIGGNNTDFFKMYAAEALRFATTNQERPCNFPGGLFNAVYEQHLYYCLSVQHAIPVQCYTSITNEDDLNYMFKDITPFRDMPVKTDYIHLFGDCKRDRNICEELERKVKLHYPELHNRIVSICEYQTLQSTSSQADL